MTIDEAIAINAETVNFCVARLMGDVPKPLSREYTLRELIDARDMIEARNGTELEGRPGYVSYTTVSDDRIIAAMYAMLNFEPQSAERPDPILIGIDCALFCIRLKNTGEIKGTDSSVFCPHCDAEEDEAWEIAPCPGEWKTFRCRECGREYEVLNDSCTTFRSRGAA